MNQQRHPTLPQNLTPEELQSYIQRASVERFKDKTKRYFTEEEISQFEKESSQNGRTINRLNAILQQASIAVKKGIQEDLVITIPANDGTTNYDRFRRQNDDLVESGYEELDVDVFGIVNHDNEVMEYFTLDGKNIPERTRPLSVKEKQQYLTIRPMATSTQGNGEGAKLYIQEGGAEGQARTGTEG